MLYRRGEWDQVGLPKFMGRGIQKRAVQVGIEGGSADAREVLRRCR